MFTAVHVKVICPRETTRDYWVRKKPNEKPEGKQPQGSCLHHDAIMTSLCGQNDVAKLFFYIIMTLLRQVSAGMEFTI